MLHIGCYEVYLYIILHQEKTAGPGFKGAVSRVYHDFERLKNRTRSHNPAKMALFWKASLEK